MGNWYVHSDIWLEYKFLERLLFPQFRWVTWLQYWRKNQSEVELAAFWEMGQKAALDLTLQES